MNAKNENGQASTQKHVKDLDDERDAKGKNQNEGALTREIDEITESEDTNTREGEDVSPGITGLTEDEDETDIEGNDEGEEDTKRRRRIGPFIMGIIAAILIISVLFALFTYSKKPEPEPDRVQVSPSPAQIFKAETLFQKKRVRPEHFSLTDQELSKVVDLMKSLQNKHSHHKDLWQLGL